MPKGLVHYYFRRKNDLLQALVERLPIEPLAYERLIVPGDVTTTLGRLVAELDRRHASSAVLSHLLWREVDTHPAVRTALHARFERVTEQIREVLAATVGPRVRHSAVDAVASLVALAVSYRHAVAGFITVSMVITYFLSVYSRRPSRNAFAQALHQRTGNTGSAAVIVGALADRGGAAADGFFSSTANALRQIDQSHRSYPGAAPLPPPGARVRAAPDPADGARHSLAGPRRVRPGYARSDRPLGSSEGHGGSGAGAAHRARARGPPLQPRRSGVARSRHRCSP